MMLLGCGVAFALLPGVKPSVAVVCPLRRTWTKPYRPEVSSPLLNVNSNLHYHNETGKRFYKSLNSYESAQHIVFLHEMETSIVVLPPS